MRIDSIVRPPSSITTETGSRSFLTESLHIIALSSFAVAQPLFDLLGSNATFFAAHQSTTLEIVMWAAVLLVAVPVGVIFVEAAVSFFSLRVRYHIHTIAVSCLGGLVVAPPVVRAFELNIWIALPLFVALSSLVGVIYRSTLTFPRVLSYTAVAPLLFVSWFFLATPVNGIVFDTSDQLSGVTTRSEAPVVLVVLDEFNLGGLVTPSGQINSERFPNFGRLASRSTWYANAMTVHDQSAIAVTSILTGILPEPDAVPTSSAFPRSLFTLLSNVYDLEVQESVTHLCPVELCDRDSASQVGVGLGALLQDSAVVFAHMVAPSDARQRWLPDIDNRWSGFVSDADPASDDSSGLTIEDIRETTRQSLRAREEHLRWEVFLQGLGRRDRPTLFYLHSLLPHSPWRYLPDGRIYDNDFFGDLFRDGRGGHWHHDTVYTDQGIQRFLLQTQFVDYQLGRMLDKLEVTGLLDESLVIVLADHGITFTPGAPRRNLNSGASREEILPIPMFIKYPGQERGAISTVPAQTVDILPTIAGVLGIIPDWEFVGSSLAPGELHRESSLLVTPEGVEDPRIEPLEAATGFAQQISTIFGDGSEPFDVYGIGEYRDLLGSRLDTLHVSDQSSSFTANVSQIDVLRDVDTQGMVIPARIVGTLSAEPEAQDLALGLNDRVSGVARAYFSPDDNEWRFSFFVPTALLAPGCNDLSIYEIRSGRVLLSIPLQEAVGC